VGTHMLTVATDSITWSLSNQGQALYLTGGSVSWPEASSNQPRLTAISFDGTPLWSGSEKPTSYSFSTSQALEELDTVAAIFSFDGPLGTGTHQLQASFQNPVDGTSCSVVETYVSH